ncbi:MFS transporter [Demequina sp. NBRC 110051]|uniref:MFS transporter n=1 Tax=Demequina sp. NBRC 110051 TaxID=1570340 RepID=UPI0009FD4CAF|nr:MFS transporter [Demequina sp. NBRC 110051]
MSSSRSVSTRRGVALPLLVLTTAQLMLVLDDSIVNIALPTIEEQIGVAPVILPWVVNAYILAFGALLLVGGRAGDILGRRRTLRWGVAVFILGSLLGGLASSASVLILARAVQGVGAALTAPSVLALITTTFTERSVRDKAIAVYGAMSGVGIILGLLLGGVLTDTVGWRAVFLVNVPIGLAVLAGTTVLPRAAGNGGRLAGTDGALVTGGMLALVAAITRFADAGLGESSTWALVAAGAALLAAFVARQRRSADPLLPLAIVRDRVRAGAYLTTLLVAVGPMGAFYVVTLYLQHVRDLTPLQTGLAWLPFAAGIFIGAAAGTAALTRLHRGSVASIGAAAAAVAMAWLSLIAENVSYWTHLAPAMALLAVGFGATVIATTQSAVERVDANDVGVASATLNAAQQVGVALGIATLGSVAAAITSGATAASADAALIEGYQGALLVGAVIVAVGAVIATTMMRASTQASEAGQAAMHG